MKNLFGEEVVEYRRLGDIKINWELLEEDLFIMEESFSTLCSLKNCIYNGINAEIGDKIEVVNPQKILVEVRGFGLVNANKIILTFKDFRAFKMLRNLLEKH